MNKAEEMTDKGDQYAKRMLVRKRELHNSSPECYSKSLRRRLSIMEAINKNHILPPRNSLHYEGNPFQREFANTSGISEEIVRRQAKSSSTDDPLTSSHDRTYSVESPQRDDEDRRDETGGRRGNQFGKSDRTDKNFNSIEYCNSSQFQLDHESRDKDDCEYETVREPRMSLGEYFRSSTHKELNMTDCVSESRSFEEEFERGNAELQRQGPDVFFSARVLEILEPQVVNAERQSSSVAPTPHPHPRRRASEMQALVEENFREMRLEDEPVDASMTMSFASEDIRELDREIDKLEFQPDVLDYVDEHRDSSQPIISETPKSKIYPNLELVKRMSDNFTPKKLFHATSRASERPSDTTDYYADVSRNPSRAHHRQEPPKRAPSPVAPENDVVLYRSPMPIAIASAPRAENVEYFNVQDYRDLYDDTSEVSSIKHQSRSFLGNLHLPRIGHCKPNLESTRKIFSSGGKTVSPSSMISTLTIPNTPSSPPGAYESMQTIHQQSQQAHRHRQRNPDGTLPFEVENFLELALGDEHCNSSVTYAYSEMRDRTNSHINASELISEDRTPTKNRKSKRIPATEPSKNRSTLDRTLTIYRTLTQRIKKRFRGGAKERQPSQQRQTRDLAASVNPKELKDSVKKLLAEVDIQQTLIYQASKALELCNSMRAFVSSPERVESERLLILAKLRKRAAQDEIGRLSSQSSEHGLYCERGELTLRELSLQLREDVLRRERQGGDVAEWFVCVVSEGSTVWSTQAVECPTSSPRLYFPDRLTIPGLPPDFRLVLTLYSLRMPKQLVFNHEDKYRIQGVGGGTGGGGSHHHRSSTCPSPKALLRRSEKRRALASPKQHEIRFSGIQDSSFVPSGSVELVLHDLNLKSPWPLVGVPPKSVLHGTVDLSLSCRLELSVSHAGFLTHGEEVGGLLAWNRRWCVLEGHSLFFWNYPREQECKPPLYAIDLVNCASRRIGLIDRSLCAKPRTLLVETARHRSAVDRDSIFVECRSNFTIVRNLLSCDTNQDLTEWQSKLNHAVSALREWSVIDKRLDS